MKRMKVMFGQRRIMILATLAILVLAAAALAASSASFTATSANPDNVFSTGDLKIGNYLADGSTDNEGKAIADLTMSNMAPGDSKTGTAVIKNAGTVSGTFTLSAVRQEGNSDLYNALQCVVTEDGSQVYAGSVAGLADQDLNGGASWPAGVARTYDITVTLPSTAGDAVQGVSTKVQFNWDAVSD